MNISDEKKVVKFYKLIDHVIFDLIISFFGEHIGVFRDIPPISSRSKQKGKKRDTFQRFDKTVHIDNFFKYRLAVEYLFYKTVNEDRITCFSPPFIAVKRLRKEDKKTFQFTFELQPRISGEVYGSPSYPPIERKTLFTFTFRYKGS